MEEVLKLEQKIVPELVELLEKRYNILRTIYYNQPIGRRVLANSLEIGERIVRTEINFLKNQNFIEINTAGMNITKDGEEIIDKLKDFIHALKGLSDIEKIIKDNLKLKDVIVIPGDVEEDKTVMNELGKVAANYLKSVIKDNNIVAITGGSTIKEVVNNMPKISSLKNVMVVPARGGIGRDVETQANTIAANLANKIDGSYKLLHVPDNLSHNAMNTIIQEKDIKDILETIKNANILLYGVGKATQMAKRRGLLEEELKEIEKAGAVGEAFGYYFNKKGEIIYSTPTIGVKNEDLNNMETLIAVAAGKEKATAIFATQLNNSKGVLITDEGAARELLNLIK